MKKQHVWFLNVVMTSVITTSGCSFGNSASKSEIVDETPDNSSQKASKTPDITPDSRPNPIPSVPPEPQPSASPVPRLLADNATLRVVNTSYDSAVTHVSIDDQAPSDLQNLAIQQVSKTLFRPVGTNLLSLEVQQTHDERMSISDIIPVDMNVNTHSTLVSFGPMNVIQHVVMQYDKSQTLPADQAQIEILHGSFVGSDIARGDVDIYVTPPELEILNNATTSLEYGSYLQGINLPPGQARIRVTVKDDSSQVLFDTGTSGLNFDTGRIHTILLTDDISTANSSMSAIVINNDSSTTYLDKSTAVYFKVVHLLNNAPSSEEGAIEFHNTAPELLAPSELFASLQYLSTEPVSDGLFAALPEGDYQFSVSPDTDVADDAFFSAPNQNFEKGLIYTLIMSGDAAQSDMHFITTNDEMRAISSLARVKVVNAAPSLESMNMFITPAGLSSSSDIENQAPEQANFQNVDFSQGTEYLNFLPGNYDIHITENNRVITRTENVSLNPITVSSLIVYDTADVNVDVLTIDYRESRNVLLNPL